MELWKSVAKRIISWFPKPLATRMKYFMELRFQKEFARQFEANPSMILEDWKVYHDLDRILEICQINDITKVLDVGCGISTVLHFIGGERYGIDPLAGEYKKFYRYPDGIKIMKCSGEVIPFLEGYFDVVFCSNALDHCSDPRKTVSEIHRVLKRGGYFVLTVEVFPNNQPRGFEHPHTFTRGFVRTLVGSKFRTVFEKGATMTAMGIRKCNGKEETFLVPSPNKTTELVMLLRKGNG